MYITSVYSAFNDICLTTTFIFTLNQFTSFWSVIIIGLLKCVSMAQHSASLHLLTFCQMAWPKLNWVRTSTVHEDTRKRSFYNSVHIYISWNSLSKFSTAVIMSLCDWRHSISEDAVTQPPPVKWFGPGREETPRPSCAQWRDRWHLLHTVWCSPPPPATATLETVSK